MKIFLKGNEPALRIVVLGLVLTLVSVGCRAVKSNPAVTLRISRGKLTPPALIIPAGAALIVQNDDAKVYTLEGAGVLSGDVPIEAKSTQTLQTLPEPGRYSLLMEEDPAQETAVTLTGVAKASTQPTTVELARAAGRQPVVFDEKNEPTYAAYTGFNLTVRGEQERQALLQDLDLFNRQLMAREVAALPEGVRPYVSQSRWDTLRPSVALVVGLGPGSFEANRFGARLAARKPRDLHPIAYASSLGFDAKISQKEVLVRVTSQSYGFNQQVCRALWRRLVGKIAAPTLDAGYANPGGRSPILGGFFDGTGNPIGKEREAAVFGASAGDHDKEKGGTYLALFKIRFDEDRFVAHKLSEQEGIIGRERESGRRLTRDTPTSHRAKTEGDGTRAILRQGFVYDTAPSERGMLFAALQGSLTRQFEGILRGYMTNERPLGKAGKDRLLEYMHFESGGYYFVPPVPKNSFPGDLEK